MDKYLELTGRLLPSGLFAWFHLGTSPCSWRSLHKILQVGFAFCKFLAELAAAASLGGGRISNWCTLYTQSAL